MTINKEKIITLIGEARNALGQLARYEDVSLDALLKDDEKLGNIKYQLIILIEACIDMCAHITAKSLNVAPESYSHCFQLLQENNFIDEGLADKMSEMAKFRNLLVHLYWKVDNIRVIEIAQTNMDICNEFIHSIVRIVKRES